MKDSAPKLRIDQLLCQKGLAPSRERAQALILAGQVLVAEQRVAKPSERYPENAAIRVKGPDHPYVSRGGVKLAAALTHFDLRPAGKVCLDLGASTGGFTDCLLQKGASRVYAFDSGTNQLHFRLRQDPRVISRENFNARFLQGSDLPEAVELIVMDVSFISLKLLLPPLLQAVPGPWELLMLVKPQFEAGKGQVGKGGVIRDEALRLRIVEDLSNFIAGLGLEAQASVPAVIAGEKGNQEYFLAAKWPKNR
ncbi:MAG TPA: TlyA family rRNA (cytidine-2'-O)-methyltransferase [Deltaproteobacteria bacterium]|nr:TlyA family rRNA (cytidine-2'-O)-methyltransferase [Deltaproteobacteria bacterium]